MAFPQASNLLHLTTFERMQLAQWLSAQQGDVGFIRQAMGILDKLELNEEERHEVGFEQVGPQARWNDTEREFEIEFEASELLVLKPVLQAQWPVNRLILQMLEKIEKAVGKEK